MVCDFKVIFTNNETFFVEQKPARKGLSNVINALVRIFFLKGRLHGARTGARFFNAMILSRLWEWSGSGTNTRLRTRLAVYQLAIRTSQLAYYSDPKAYIMYCLCSWAACSNSAMYTINHS